jgi:hypothetical protein
MDENTNDPVKNVIIEEEKNENTNNPINDTIIEDEKIEDRNIKIKSKILDDLTCIVYFKDGKLKAQPEYKLRPLPSEPSK